MMSSFQSGWCLHCGMRRGTDDRCSNCDPWWTHPLLQQGSLIIILAIAGTFVMISIAKSKERDFEEASVHHQRRQSAFSPATVRDINTPLPGFTTSSAAADAALMSGLPPAHIGIYAPPQVSAPQQFATNRRTLSDDEQALESLFQLRNAVYNANTQAREHLYSVIQLERRARKLISTE